MIVTRRTREHMRDYRARRDMTARLAEELRLPPEEVERSSQITDALTLIGIPVVVTCMFIAIYLGGSA